MDRGLREARRMSNMKKSPNRALSIANYVYHPHLDQYITITLNINKRVRYFYIFIAS